MRFAKAPKGKPHLPSGVATLSSRRTWLDQAIGVQGAAAVVSRTCQPVEVEEETLFGVEADRAVVPALDDVQWNFGEDQAGTARHCRVSSGSGVIQGNTNNNRVPYCSVCHSGSVQPPGTAGRLNSVSGSGDLMAPGVE